MSVIRNKVRSVIIGEDFGPSKIMDKFDPQKEYGVYALMGVDPNKINIYLKNEIKYACVVTELPGDNPEVRKAIKSLMEIVLKLCIPKIYHSNVQWIEKKSLSFFGDGISSIGWIYKI